MKKSKPTARSAPKKKTTPAAALTAGSDSPMDVGLLQQIVNLMSSNDLNTVDLRDGQRRIVLRRGAAPAAAPGYYPYSLPPATSAPVGAAAATPSAPAPAAQSPAAAADTDAGLVPIKSPMVGTFYARSGPDAKPFVSVGATVEDDTDVCIIEAMKVFNNIKAECRGTIARVLVEDRQTVEFGQVLFLVKP